MNIDLMTFAEIGGVFVGFAALISFSSKKSVEETWLLINTTIGGLFVMGTTLLYVLPLSYGLTEGQAVRFASVIWLVLYLPSQIMTFRAFGQEGARADYERSPWYYRIVTFVGDGVILVALLLIAIDAVEQYSTGLYVTCVSIVLLQAAMGLLRLLMIRLRDSEA